MKIVIIGTGNVATQLGFAFKNAGHTILQVYGRDLIKASSLAKVLNAHFTNLISTINTTADIYLFAVSDSYITRIAKELLLKKQLVVHTSGSVTINVFKNKYINYGVFYPVQSILKNRKVDFKNTPICLEAINESSSKQLLTLAKSVSNTIYILNSEQRSQLHLAAVFVNNFTNHLFVIAERILSKKDISFDLLKPLIKQTADNIKKSKPFALQTGPALRGDTKILRKHLRMLDNMPQYKRIYQNISESIRKQK